VTRGGLAALAAGLAGWSLLAAAAPCRGWPAWERFEAAYIDEQGRVAPRSDPAAETVSEGEAYALFAALVAGDRPAFARLVRFTDQALSGGRLGERLPAWRYGPDAAGELRILDDNAAADADVWIAYALLEAGTAFGEAGYRRRGHALAATIARDEVAEIEGFGPLLLPAPRGFRDGDRVRLNPSYLPLSLLERLAREGEPWRRMPGAALALLEASAHDGLVPDWVALSPGTGPVPADGGRGSYDAIRVYLWAGLLAATPARRELLATLAPMARLLATRGTPPAWFDPATGRSGGDGPRAFAAALVPFLTASGEAATARRLRRQAEAPGAPAYYDDVLALLALAHADGRYRFAADGRLWRRGGACARSS
jgi:endoglucanase